MEAKVTFITDESLREFRVVLPKRIANSVGRTRCALVHIKVVYKPTYVSVDVFNINVRGKNGFTKVSKNLVRYRSENNLFESSKYVERLNVDDKVTKSFNILANSLNV